MSVVMILYEKVGKNRMRSGFLLKKGMFFFLGTAKDQKNLLLSLSYVKNDEEKSKNILLSKKS